MGVSQKFPRPLQDRLFCRSGAERLELYYSNCCCCWLCTYYYYYSTYYYLVGVGRDPDRPPPGTHAANGQPPTGRPSQPYIVPASQPYIVPPFNRTIQTPSARSRAPPVSASAALEHRPVFFFQGPCTCVRPCYTVHNVHTPSSCLVNQLKPRHEDISTCTHGVALHCMRHVPFSVSNIALITQASTTYAPPQIEKDKTRIRKTPSKHVHTALSCRNTSLSRLGYCTVALSDSVPRPANVVRV